MGKLKVNVKVKIYLAIAMPVALVVALGAANFTHIKAFITVEVGRPVVPGGGSVSVRAGAAECLQTFIVGGHYYKFWESDDDKCLGGQLAAVFAKDLVRRLDKGNSILERCAEDMLSLSTHDDRDYLSKRDRRAALNSGRTLLFNTDEEFLNQDQGWEGVDHCVLGGDGQYTGRFGTLRGLLSVLAGTGTVQEE